MSDEPRPADLDLGTLAEIRPGAWLGPDDQMVVNDELVRGLRFAHRATADELAGGWLEVVPDFAAVAAFAHRWALDGDGEVVVAEAEGAAGHGAVRLVLRGPDGWLADGEEGQRVLLTTAGNDLTVVWDPPAPEADVDPGPVIAAFHRLAAGSPVPLLDLVLRLLVEHRPLFEADAPVPLHDVLALAGLVVEGTTVRRSGPPGGAGGDAVGIPGLDVASAVAAERLLGAVLAVDRGEDIDPEVADALADVDGVAAVAEQLVGGDLVSPSRLAATLDRLTTVAGRPGHAGLAFLRSRLAEWLGDAAAQQEALQPALAAGFPSAQVDAAWFAADRGDAREAVSLLRSARVPDDDPDLQLLARYTTAGPQLVGRNDRCWCGSGRKHKHCCLRLNGHDLEARTPWLHAKAVMFLQRPPQRPMLLGVATASAGVERAEDAPERVIAAACDGTVAELCLFEGGLFERFLDQRGALLPDDELALARSWAASRHRPWEVLAGGRVLRDPETGEERELDALSAARLPPSGLVLAVAQPGPVALPGPALPIAAAQLDALSRLLADGAAEPLAALLGREFGWTAAPDLGSAVDPAPGALAAP
jgi:hypothetical protein